jgi:hypothetical protein
MNMAISDHMADIKQKRQEQKQDRLERYRQLVIDSTDNAEIDPSVAAEILTAAGRSMEEFSEDCAVRERRIVWAETLKGERDANEELQSADDEIRKIRSERDAAVQRFNAKIEKWAMVRAQAQDKLTAISQAKSNLERTAGHHIREDELGIQKEMRRRGEHHQEIEINLKHLKSQLIKFQQLANNKNSPDNPISVKDPQRKFYQESCAKQKAEIAAIEQRLADARAESNELTDRLAELQREKLVP